MAVTGIIAEFDPFHGGHARLIGEAKRLFPQNGIVCVMSGGFTQRGAPSCADKIARAKMAVENGADLVFELPVAFALAPAPVFAKGGVSHLAATGMLSHLVFGSESGDVSALKLAAREAGGEEFSRKVKSLMSEGATYAAAAASALSEESAKLVSNPNDLLAVEYIRAISGICPWVSPFAVKRVGAAHGSFEDGGEFPSASKVRALAKEGTAPAELPLPSNVREILAFEAEAGRFPLRPEKLDAAVLAVIGRMGEDELDKVPEGGDGLAKRIAAAAGEVNTVEELCAAAKSRNFTLARVRRCVWQAFLGITVEDQSAQPRYLRVLAVGKGGRELLREMEAPASVPIITKPSSLNRLSPEAGRQAFLESRADSLRSLALAERENMLRRSPFVAL